jgi:copper chaperone CopZ
MTHTYNIAGMTCTNCEAKVRSALLTLPDVVSAEVSQQKGTATVTMEKHIPLAELQKAITAKGNYEISSAHHSEAAEQARSWFTTYKPVLLIFVFITCISVIASFQEGQFHFMHWMNYFMAGFFIAFSFFKLLDLRGFAESYSMYDIVARRLPAWGYIYAFIELALGIAYLTPFDPLLTNAVTFLVMSVSITGVLQSVVKRRKIQCACLGAVFNLPMSTITIMEDALMILMSGISLATFII